MKIWPAVFLLIFWLRIPDSVLASDHADKKPAQAHDHDHKAEGAETDKHEDHNQHGDHGDHGDEASHAEHGEEEAPKNVGPNKGITSYDEAKGFVLSSEATKNFRVESQQIQTSGPWNIPSRALLITGEEKSVYRLREGYLKRIRVEVQKKSKGSIAIVSPALRSGDSVVTSGVGFLRIADVDLTSGESGHHH